MSKFFPRKTIQNTNNCPLIQAINVIGGKWKLAIIHLLHNRNLRFGKLHHRMKPISKKVLVEKLKELEYDGIILRNIISNSPKQVEYSLTTKGKGLLPILDNLSTWSKENLEIMPFESV